MRRPAVMILISTGVLCMVAALVACSRGRSEAEAESHLRIATELKDNKLFDEAVAEYEQALAVAGIDEVRRANINYLIGKVYFEHLYDYEKAAAFFLRSREYDPNATYATELSKKLVASLEKTGRTLDARRALDASANIEPKPAREGDLPVARIGGDPIYRSEIEDRIQQLPPDVQSRLTSPEARTNYLRQYVGVELIYRAAQREGYDESPEMNRRREQMIKNFVVEQYVADKVMPKVSIDTADVRNYYTAHRDDRYGGAPYDSVRARVFSDYHNEKTEAAYANYVQQLAEAENVQFFEKNLTE